jgi:hypothetical protein
MEKKDVISIPPTYLPSALSPHKAAGNIRERGAAGKPQSVYNRRVSLKNVDIESALRRIADKRIEEAMREGKFDNLPGTGKPLNPDPMPAEENARMTCCIAPVGTGERYHRS